MFPAQPHLVKRRVKVTGSFIGSPREIRDMLQLAVDKQVRPWIKEVPMKDVNQALIDQDKGLAKYRFVLVNE